MGTSSSTPVVPGAAAAPPAAGDRECNYFEEYDDGYERLYDESFVRASLAEKRATISKCVDEASSFDNEVPLVIPPSREAFAVYLEENKIVDYYIDGTSAIEKLLNLYDGTLTTGDLTQQSYDVTTARAIAIAILAPGANQSLISLFLHDNSLGPDGTKILCQAFQQFTTLPALTLSANNLGDEGLVVLAAGLKLCTQLTSLDLSTNKINDDGAIALSILLPSLSNLTNLSLEDNLIGVYGAVSLFDVLRLGCPAITDLNLFGNNIAHVGGIAMVTLLQSQHCKLTAVRLGHNDMTDFACAAICKSLAAHPAHVTHLDLTANHVEVTTVDALAETLQHPECKLHVLELGHCSHLTDIGCVKIAHALQTNTTVASLNMASWMASEEGGSALLTMLASSGNSIQGINLMNNNLHLITNHALFTAALHANNKLRSLILCNNKLTGSACAALAEGLKTNETLIELNLYENEADDEGMISLAGVLATSNNTLTSLDIRHNHIGVEGSKALALALHTNTGLTTIEMSNNTLGDEGTLPFADILRVNSTLALLALVKTKMSERVKKAVKTAAEINNVCKVYT